MTGMRAESGVGPAEERADKRWPRWTGGGATRLAAAGATGVVLLVAGVAAARSVLTGFNLTPSASIALFAVVAVFVIAGMSIGPRGEAAGLAVRGVTGAALLLVGVGATRAVLGDVRLTPWAGVALFAIVVAVAIIGMLVAARVMTDAPAARPEADANAPAPAPDASVPPTPVPVETGVKSARDLPLDRFQVETREGRRIVTAASVDWVEAHGNYARLHLPDESFLYRAPLAQLEKELDTRQFLRVHRSAIVNLDAIRRVEPLPSGDAELWLASGASVRMSRRYAKAFHVRTGRGH
jgi:hypothetical protein